MANKDLIQIGLILGYYHRALVKLKANDCCICTLCSRLQAYHITVVKKRIAIIRATRLEKKMGLKGRQNCYSEFISVFIFSDTTGFG